MKRNVRAGALLLGSFTWAKDGPWFSGKIVYHNTFKTLAGQDITDKLAPIFGSDDPYYIADNNYSEATAVQAMPPHGRRLHRGRPGEIRDGCP